LQGIDDKSDIFIYILENLKGDEAGQALTKHIKHRHAGQLTKHIYRYTIVLGAMLHDMIDPGPLTVLPRVCGLKRPL
jgi:hypothetical protein